MSQQANGVRVLLVLEPATYFGIFEFPGAQRFSYSRLVQITNYPPQAPYNAGDVNQAQAGLLKFFQQQGFFEAAVKTRLEQDPTHRIVNVVFAATLHRRSKFGQVRFSGITDQETSKLRHDLQSIMARLRGAAIRPRKNYRYRALTNATRRLQSELGKQGWLGARVELSGAEYHSDTNRADIAFNVNTGPKIHVKIEGAHLWSWDRKSLLPVYQGVGVNPELVQEGSLGLESYFQGKGYFDVEVTSDFQHQGAEDTIVYSIAKGKKHKVAVISIAGNTKPRSAQDLMQYVAVKKAHFFSRGKYSADLVRTSVTNLTNVYRSDGFSSVKVTSNVANRGGNIRVSFHIDRGTQDIVHSLRIEGAGTLSQAQFAPQGLKLTPGSPYSQNLVDADRQNITAHYLQLGYLTANFRETAASESKNDSHQVNVVYHIYEGPRVFTSSVITLGRKYTQQRLINQDISSIQPEHPLTLTHLLTAESQLYNHTGVFDWAEVDSKRQITTQTQEDVLIKVHESPKNQIRYGFGFEIVNRGGNIPSGTVAFPNLPPIGLPSNFTTTQQTYYGPRGTFEYTRNNVRGKGESISFTAFAGRLDQRAAAYYLDPNFRWSKWRANTSISVDHDGENPIYSSQQELASYQLQRNLNRAGTNILLLRYSFSKTDLTRIEIPALVPTADQHVRLSTIAASFTRDTRDNPLDSHKGVFETIEFDLNPSALGSSVNFVRMNSQAAYYKKIPNNIIWANSIRIGLAQPLFSSFVPLSEEFFTGGGSTLRGFPLDGAGPQRQVPVCSSGSSTNCTLIQVPAGGNELLILNSEFRIPLPIMKNLGLAVFYDGGNVFPRIGFHDFTSLYSNNVGLGLRYHTPVGPIRVDLGRNLNPIPGIQATQYFVSIGQAF